MTYTIVELEERKVNGLKITTSNEDLKSISDLWQTFLSNPSQQTDRINNKTIGLYINYEGDYSLPYDFLTCYESNHLPLLVIPKGKYAKFILTGNPQKVVGEFWTKLWNLNLNRAYIADFEEYQNNNNDINDQEIHIYISIN